MKNYTKYLTGGLSAAVLTVAFMASPSHAQDTNYLSNQATHCEIFKGLSRELPTECQKGPKTRGLKTRGIVFHPDPEQQQQQAQNSQQQVQVAENTASAPAQTGELSISFRAEFEYNSARLTPAARQVIDKVAAVLNHEMMQGKVIRIEGHADASGSDNYNLSLSERRARAVHAYLVRTHNVDAQRLQYVGKGESELFDPRNPTSGVNRRVEFRNVTG